MLINVTQENFLDVLPQIEKSISNADFLAFDFEFFGLDQSSCSLFDSPAERYEILKRSVTKFAPCQLGLSTYSQTIGQNYEAVVYSIPLFQSSGGSEDFTISKDAMRFLKSNDFNFENVLDNGVQYCTRKQLKSFSLNSSKLNLLDCEIIENLEFATNFDVDFPEKLSHFEKLLITSKLAEKYSDLQFSIGGEVLHVNKGETSTNYSSLFETLVLGVTKIFETIIDSKIPIVGHNSFVDLMYIFHYFIDDLPDSYQLYKSILHSKLPRIFDTKYLAKTKKISNILQGYEIIDNSFETLSLFFQSPVSYRITPQNLRKSTELVGNFHDAAFDSYHCGLLFIKLSHLLIDSYEDFINFPRMYSLINEIVMNRIPINLTDVEYCDLTKLKDEVGNRPDIIRIRKKLGDRIFESDKLNLIKKLKWQLENYRTSVRIAKNEKILEIATNTATTYAFVCEKFSKNKDWIVCDENDDMSVTYEQRLTSSTKIKTFSSDRRNIKFDIARMENALTNKNMWLNKQQ